MAKIGDVEFNLIKESRSFPNEISRHPTESGANIADHVRSEDVTFDIRGVVGDNEDPPKKHSLLKQISKKEEVVDYVGRAVLFNCLVEDFQTDVDVSSKRGFTFSMTIRQIKISKPSTVSTLPVSLKVEVKDVGDVGRVQAK